MNAKKCLTGFMFFLVLFILISGINAQTYDFEVWAAGPNLFTIGRPEMVNVYVRNLGDVRDSYTISYTKEATKELNDVKHLISVSIPSSRINLVEPNRTSTTFATITLLGPIDDGNVTFNITSIGSSDYEESFIEIMTGSTINLPEFELTGLIQLLILASLLVVSYTSHFR